MEKIILIFLLFPALNLWSQNIDINILKDINLSRNKRLDNTFRFITNSATPVAFGLPAILFCIGLMKNDSLTKRNALYIGASVVSTTAIVTILKYSVNRPRPFETYPFIEKVTSGGSPSFPSGHTSDAFALATAVSLAYPKWYVIIPSYAWAGVVGYSRMDLGVHYPSDVLVSAIIGASCAYLCYRVNQKLNKHTR